MRIREASKMPGLFEPITIKGLVLKNRLIMPPMNTRMATEDGECTERHIRHYMARATGGVGLIIIEHTTAIYSTAISLLTTGQKMYTPIARTLRGSD